MWAEAQGKLFDFADNIEVWRHTGELLREELTLKKPVAHPCDKELTDRTKYWLGRRTVQLPNDLRTIVESAYQQRERDSVDALIKMCRKLCEIHAERYRQIRHGLARGQNLGPTIAAIFNDDQITKCWIRLKYGDPRAPDL
ncbi:MAG: hypothetical protein RMJ82_15755, partial [Gemmatales bacterium]|nr:hypothetical protein [Gemmatales bacterium]